jgi:hypothetical protein
MDEFIKQMFLRDTINASIQHNHIYSNQNGKDEFKECWKCWLIQLSERYNINAYTEKKYCEEIENLKNHLNDFTSEGHAVVNINIGTSQKSISLWLKYLWLSGDPNKKPFFPPIDSKVIRYAQLEIHPLPCWTRIGTIHEYLNIIHAMQEKDFIQPTLTDWE